MDLTRHVLLPDVGAIERLSQLPFSANVKEHSDVGTHYRRYRCISDDDDDKDETDDDTTDNN